MSLTLYRLEKPNLEKIQPADVVSKLEPLGEKFRDLFLQANTPDYLYWDKLKYKIPTYDLAPEEGWFLIRQLRSLTAGKTFLRAENDAFFTWFRLPNTDELLHRIDMNLGGSILPQTFSSSNKNQFIVRGIMEEAIASSQLEGAHTTRAVAKKMLLENRPPQNTSEKMIVNNYKTIMAIEEQHKNSKLSLELMFSLHAQLIDGTDVSENDKGRLRNDKDDIVVHGPIGSQIYITHVPPKESFLKEEIKRLIAFANDEEGNNFIHPIIKAIFLHFWIGYLHPFTDGNGRLARALFYWYLLRKGYWTIVYLPISLIIKRAPAQYAMAYIYTEQDGFDLTYFYDFHIKKFMQALDEFQSYIQSKLQDNRKLDDSLGREINLNDRQKQLLHYLLGDKNASVTVTSHSDIHKISRQTAAKDLKELQAKGLLISKREGKFIRFYADEKLLE